MKVIFLDIDGVLNVIPSGFDIYGGIFHTHFVNNLKRLIEQTNAKIVITSSWRWSGLEFMQNMWIARGYPGEVIDITPYDFILVRLGLFKNENGIKRGHEIKHWLDTHTDVENYVILDDDRDMLKSQLNHFVCTHKNNSHHDCIDDGFGLTEICTEKAIKILNGK